MGDDKADRRRELARARALRREGRLADARALAMPWSSRRGHRLPALLAMSEIELAADEPLRALAHADDALVRRPGHVGASIARARALAALGRSRDALRLLDPAARVGEEREAMLLARARLLADDGQRTAAIRLLDDHEADATPATQRLRERLAAREMRAKRRHRLPAAVREAIRATRTRPDTLDAWAEAAALFAHDHPAEARRLDWPAEASAPRAKVEHPVRLIAPSTIDGDLPLEAQRGAVAALLLDLVRLRDFDLLEPLLARARSSDDAALGLLADIAECELAWRHQAYDEAIAAAAAARRSDGWAALDDDLAATLRVSLDAIETRAQLTIGASPARRSAGTGSRALKRDLNLLWRSDPAEGLALAQRIATGKRANVRAQVLAATLPLLAGDADRAGRHLDGLLLRLRSRGEPLPADLALAGAAVARGGGDATAYRRFVDAFFARQALETPAWTGDWMAFDTLGSSTSPVHDGPLVSVIVTAWNAADTIDAALRSLVEQSHAALEILVVDDASDDATPDRVAGWAERDPRVRLIRAPRNGGTYRAKNLALPEASGVYVTNMDADDWSHPARIARHVAAMERWPHLVATTSGWVRMREDGMPVLRGSTGVFTHRNPGSAFMRRAEVMERIGCYDAVRIDGDLDHWRRLLRGFGPFAVAHLPAPLTIGRWHDRSLTRGGIGAQDEENYSPVRSAYRAAGLAWRRCRTTTELRFAADQPRPFPAPQDITD